MTLFTLGCWGDCLCGYYGTSASLFWPGYVLGVRERDTGTAVARTIVESYVVTKQWPE